MARLAESPTLHSVCERVYTQRRSLILTGTDIMAYTVHIAPNLWQRLMREIGEEPTVAEGTLLGLRAARDNTLNDDQIRLRHEVVA